MNKLQQKIKKNQKANKITLSSKVKDSKKITTVSSETTTVFPEREYFILEDSEETNATEGSDS